ncbi:MAG: patatin-like phospholipase family protein [Candidatus Palauibacterales bacterium]|nr:patatin-like phospholipase family protein [Candidatus Palauibacterales bacterium]MDP2582826.1 patatin-like phospholipase family protein [Candidatus Palauibacterales bacterium]
MIERFLSLSWRFRTALVAGWAGATLLVVALGRLAAARVLGLAAAGLGAMLLAWILLVPWIHDLLATLAPGEPQAAPGRPAEADARWASSGGPASRRREPVSAPGDAPSDRLARFVAQDRAPPDVDDTELRIGIVLSGGGARGVYQAGALLALREFLAREGVLPYVRAIAGTSIGAWNAMFWLTNHVEDGGLEGWWRAAEPARLIEPAHWIPGLRNYVLRNRPWRRSFGPLFGSSLGPILAGGPPWLYFTRTNVDRARVEVATNRDPSYRYHRVAPSGRGYVPVAPVVNPDLGRYRVATGPSLREAVFTSMDVPPLFPRVHGPRGVAYEDGGVLDNLPIRYTTRFEGCNLLFIFPLHASFERAHSERSILRRLGRVLEVRQGALERGALRDVSLYNELIALGAPERSADIHIKPVTSFVLAPSPAMEIGTFDFWKLRRRGESALRRMREATREALQTFSFRPDDRSVRMTVVPPSDSEPAAVRDFTLH